MCSIIGWNGNFNKELVIKLFNNSRIRGLHAFGYSYLKGELIKTEKFLDYNKFLNSITDLKPNKFIAHFRYSTSGDYQNSINNQPIQINDLSLVFNGVLDMSGKIDMEKTYNVKLTTENDGEIALLKMQISEEEFKILVKNKSFAGIFLDKKGNIKAYRNSNRPCYIANYNDIKIIASTKDIFNRSGITNANKLAINEVIEI